MIFYHDDQHFKQFNLKLANLRELVLISIILIVICKLCAEDSAQLEHCIMSIYFPITNSSKKIEHF